MKGYFLSVLSLLLLLPALSACGTYDYYDHVSDEKRDIFCAETEVYTLTVSCVRREYPFLCDGVAAQKSDLLEAVLAEKDPSAAEYEIYFLEDVQKGGDMSFRSVTGDWFYSRTAEKFPEGSLSVRIVRDGTAEEIALTSVKTENTLSPEEALKKATDSEKDYLAKMTRGGVFYGEFHVRLLRRDKTYYYVGIVNSEGDILSLLLDSETGEILARRERT